MGWIKRVFNRQVQVEAEEGVQEEGEHEQETEKQDRNVDKEYQGFFLSAFGAIPEHCVRKDGVQLEVADILYRVVD